MFPMPAPLYNVNTRRFLPGVALQKPLVSLTRGILPFLFLNEITLKRERAELGDGAVSVQEMPAC